MGKKDIPVPVEVIRSRRKTMSLEITREGKVLVRAPLRMPAERIHAFVEEKKGWLSEHLEEVRRRQEKKEQIGAVSEEQRKAGMEAAGKKLRERTDHYAQILHVTYGRITVREQKTRWGSCSSQGNLNFNWKLILTPPEILDYVVVHELCHRLQMNHSPAFWQEVARVMPDYAQRRAWLKQNGWILDL